MEILFIIFFSYLSGSIPFGLIFTKIFIGKDVRKIGSGNIGATNVLRTGNKYLALSTLTFDILKGYVPVIITLNFFSEYVQISALMVFLGHIFPIWLKFHGGKGVATYLGILFALSLPLSILFIFTWIIVSLIFKYSSVSSMFSCLTVLVITVVKDIAVVSINPDIETIDNIKFLLFIFFILIVYTHKKNISNLKNKTEKKIKI
jgi:acyl phosphate:glycerol-3-phosphate acyltransferase